jgi:hypothetical protein
VSTYLFEAEEVYTPAPKLAERFQRRNSKKKKYHLEAWNLRAIWIRKADLERCFQYRANWASGITAELGISGHPEIAIPHRSMKSKNFVTHNFPVEI